MAEGATVALADVDGDSVRNAAAALGPGAVAIRMDVTRQDEIDAGFAEAIGALGQLDILINNAALFTAAPIAEITRAEYDRVVAVNAGGTFFFLQAAARHMIARGQGGKILNLASPGGSTADPLVDRKRIRKNASH